MDTKLDAGFQEHINDDSVQESAQKRREAALVRKLDYFIAPVMMLLMLISYLDRGNIGFAATQGMTQDINLKGSELNTAVSVFYIFYVLAEFPTSIFVKRLQFNRVIPAITFCWGVVCLSTGFVQGFGTLVMTRIFLGFFEGCLFPSMQLFLCNWYKREELAVRVSYLFIASALAGAFGGLLAWAILNMDGVAGYPGWRWIYIIEGCITVFWAFICIFVVPKNYDTAYFLNSEDKALMRQRAEHMKSYSGGPGRYGKKDIREAAKDVKSWLHGVIQIAVVTILYGFGTFLPIIIKSGFHYSTVQAQYLVIPVNLWGALFYAVGAYLSDRHQSRFLPLILCAPFGIAGYAICLAGVSAGVQYFATYLISTACFLCTGGNMELCSRWEASGKPGDPADADEHRRRGCGADISDGCGATVYAWACLVVGELGVCLVWVVYKRREAWKERALVEGLLVPPEEYTDRAPDFRYII